MKTYHPLHSSVLDGFVYDEDIEQLELYLRDGRTRVFKGVPVATVTRLGKAKSPGRYYMTHIRSKFTSNEVDAI